jgi:hypothetical protein
VKAGLATIMVTATAFLALPAIAQEVAVTPVSVSTDDLPLTEGFSVLLTSYRNCVLRQVDSGQLGSQQEMAKEAMSACALARGALRSQLVTDIRSQRPHMADAVALISADGGLEQVDPMIEAAAVDWAHMRYARTMY